MGPAGWADDQYQVGELGWCSLRGLAVHGLGHRVTVMAPTDDESAPPTWCGQRGDQQKATTASREQRTGSGVVGQIPANSSITARASTGCVSSPRSTRSTQELAGLGGDLIGDDTAGQPQPRFRSERPRCLFLMLDLIGKVGQAACEVLAKVGDVHAPFLAFIARFLP